MWGWFRAILKRTIHKWFLYSCDLLLFSLIYAFSSLVFKVPLAVMLATVGTLFSNVLVFGIVYWWERRKTK